VRKKVDAAVISALEQGHNVQLVRRDNRQGFKAGAMVDGMARVADQGFEYVAIFDADFEPPEDFFYQVQRRRCLVYFDLGPGLRATQGAGALVREGTPAPPAP
jgi:hypothetical protein